MTRENLQTTIDALDDLLDAERAALLKGNLEEVSRLLERKEGLIDSLNRMDFKERTDFEGLQAKVERNQTLLDGVRPVARRLAAIRRVRQSLDTYDSHGNKRTVEVRSGGSVEKRA